MSLQIHRSLLKKHRKELILWIADKEKLDFDKLYRYVKQLMGYDENQCLPKFYFLRLKGLAAGLQYLDNKQEDMAHYQFDVVLNTFKYCNLEIQRSINKKQFSSEQKKFNYITAIVENKLNDVYKKMKQAERIQKKQEMVTVEKALSEPEYVHIFKAPEQKKLSADLEALI